MTTTKTREAHTKANEARTKNRFHVTVRRTYKAYLKEHYRRWARCKRCPIGKTTFTHVFFRGYIPAHILFIGEAPGPNENALGKPFIGESGHFFQDIIDDIIGKRKLRYCLTNLISCYPQDGTGKFREPLEAEIDKCNPRLMEFIEIVEPRLIVLVGTHAHRNRPSIAVPTVNIKHPSYIMRKHPSEQPALCADIENVINEAVKKYV